MRPNLQDPTACLRPHLHHLRISTPTHSTTLRASSTHENDLGTIQLVNVPQSGARPAENRRPRTEHHGHPTACRQNGECHELLRKEVIQPHLPVRLPCYDLVLIASPTFDGSLPQGVRPPASGVTDFHDLTGGVYKARERIHRSVADLRLLATPTSWGRVADPNPN